MPDANSSMTLSQALGGGNIRVHPLRNRTQVTYLEDVDPFVGVEAARCQRDRIDVILVKGELVERMFRG